MWKLSIKNIGGIYSATTRLNQGLNVIQASNFSGKSSFVSALQTVMGTTDILEASHPLTEGEDHGSVILDTESTSYEVRLKRSSTAEIICEGSPFIEDEYDRLCAHLFAFLGERNPIRARVRNQEDLTDLLLAPLELEDIEGQLATLEKQRRSKEDALDTAQQASETIPNVEETIESLESELSDLTEKRDSVETRISDQQRNAESLSDELASKRSDVASLEQRISRLENQLSRLDNQLSAKRSEKNSLNIPEEPKVDAELEDKKDKIETITLQVDLLEGLLRANQRVIDEDEIELVTNIDRTLVEDEFECWVCGEPTTIDSLSARLDALENKIQSLRQQKTDLSDEIESLEAKQREYQRKQRKLENIEEAIGDLTAKRDEVQRDLTQANERKEEVEETVTDLSEQVERTETQLSDELAEVKSKIKLKEQELETKRSRLEYLETKCADTEEIRAEINSIDEEITRLKERKRTKQRELKQQFDEAMDAAIDRFAPGFDGARLDIKTNTESEIEAFELVIARDGRETTIDTLSEAERELVGIIVAVAGYRTFDVADRVPLIILDGISQLSVDNLIALCEYLSGDVDMLVTTAYPEAGEFGSNHIVLDDWETVPVEEVTTT